MSRGQYFSPQFGAPEKLASGESTRYFVRNTVDVANQLLDAIEQDITDSKAAIFARDAHKHNVERENSILQQQLIEARVRRFSAGGDIHFLIICAAGRDKQTAQSGGYTAI